MYRFRLPGPRCQIELLGIGVGQQLSFQILGPSAEAAFVEELICQHFGSLTVHPKSLFSFLAQDNWIAEFFRSPVLISGDLDAIDVASMPCFSDKPLGLKLVEAGVLEKKVLDQFLEEFLPFSSQLRFGEFLRLNHRISADVIRFFLEPGFFKDQGFNQMSLEQRLSLLGLVAQPDLNVASQQQSSGRAIAEIVVESGLISSVACAFFQNVYIADNSEIRFN